jgi:hypothetical protein
MVWTVFRHSFRLLFWKMSGNDHIASLYDWVPAAFCMHNSLEQTFSLSLLMKKLQSRSKYYRLYIVKTTRGLIIKNVWHVSTDYTDTIWNFRLPGRDCLSLWISEHNVPTKWRYFGYKNNLLYNWESRECKHPKIIKGKRFILLLFWLSWPIYLAASCL